MPKLLSYLMNYNKKNSNHFLIHILNNFTINYSNHFKI